MGRYFRRRLLTAIPVFFGITFLVFVLLSLSPADVTDLGEGASGGAQQAALEEALGLDKPLPVRYLAWLGGLLRGELGQSYLSGRPVAGMLAQRVGPFCWPSLWVFWRPGGPARAGIGRPPP